MPSQRACQACGYQRDPAYLPPNLADNLCPVCDLVDILRAIQRNMAEAWPHQPSIELPRQARDAVHGLARARTSWLGLP